MPMRKINLDGWMNEYGEGVDENAFVALEWYRKAAELGHADA